MLKKVVRETTVKNAILFGSLRLFQQEQWRLTKKKSELKQLSQQIQSLMQLHLTTTNRVIGLPMSNHQVLLMEIEEDATDQLCHGIETIVETAEGQFIATRSFH